MSINDQFLSFILPSEKGIENYIHRTATKENAEHIMREGFRFVESFIKTTDKVINDQVYLNFWLKARVDYGNYIMVLSIATQLFDYYQNMLREVLGNRHVKYEVHQILTDLNPYKNDDGDLVYLLPPMFIKGFYFTDTGEISYNKLYNPFYDSQNFKENILKLI